MTFTTSAFLSRCSTLGGDTPVARLVAAAVTVAALSISILIFIRHRGGKRELCPVAPTGWIETIRAFGGSNAPWFLLDMARETGSNIFRIRVPVPGGMYIVGDPDAARQMLLDKTTDKPDLMRAANILFHGPSIFTRSITDPKWKHARKSLSPAFSSSEIGRMNQVCSRHVQDWIDHTLEPLIDKKESFDPSHSMVRITSKLILEAALEYVATDEECDNFLRHISATLREVMKLTAIPLRQYYGPLFLDESKSAVASGEEIRSFCQKILTSYRNKEEAEKSPNKTVIRLIAEDTSMTDTERISEMIVMLVAGYDTQGYTMANTLVLLAKHPEVSDKLRRDLVAMDAKGISLHKSEYLRSVIEESKRLLPVVARGIIRKTGRAFTFTQDGFNQKCHIPKNATIIFPFVMMQRIATIFKDPDQFQPERWETADKKIRDACFVFSVGPRICPGQSLAMTAIYSVISRLFLTYKFSVEKEGKLDFFLTLKYTGARLTPSRA